MKLSRAKVNWIIGEKERNALSTSEIALAQRVSPSRVRQLWGEYRRSGVVPVIGHAALGNGPSGSGNSV